MTKDTKKKEEQSMASIVVTILIGCLCSTIIHVVLSGFFVTLLGNETAEQLERLFFPPDHPITTLISSIQFCFRLINFIGSAILGGAFGIIFPFLAILFLFGYFFFSAEAAGISVKDFIKKSPEYIALWMFGLVLGCFVLYLIYPAPKELLYFTIGFTVLGLLAFFGADELDKNLPPNLKPYQPQIFVLCKLSSQFLIGLAYATGLYYAFVDCLAGLIIIPIYNTIYTPESNPLWAYLMEGARHFHQ